MKKLFVIISFFALLSSLIIGGNSSFCYSRDSYGKPVKVSGHGGSPDMTEKTKKRKLLIENIALARKEIAQYAEMIADLNKQKAEVLQEMREEVTHHNMGIHDTMGSGKMYDHVPTADEVMEDLSPSAKFEDIRHSIARIRRMMEETSQRIKKMEKELKELK